MDIVAQYICLQYDEKNADREPSCPGMNPDVCIGISGYALNFGLCAFMAFYRPTSIDALKYVIQWDNVSHVIFPVVFQLKTATQFVGTRANKPGLLKCESIGRRQCMQQKELFFLKLKPWEDSEKQLIPCESSIQDAFHYDQEADSDPEFHHRRMLLMSLARAFQDTDERFLLGKNCLMLYFAHEKTLLSLCQCAEESKNIELLFDLLSFLYKYCNFMMDVEQLYKDGKLVPNMFQILFAEYWDVDLGDYWGEEVIAQTPSVKQKEIIPSGPFMKMSELTKILEYCFLSATYEKRTKLMWRMVGSLRKRFSGFDSNVVEKLDVVEAYIADMEELRKEHRRGSH